MPHPNEDETERLKLVINGPIATLLINRPTARNAFSRQMWLALARQVERVSSDPDVKVLCLKSAVPGMFSAGADLKELRAGATDPAEAARNAEAVRLGLSALESCALVTLAAIDGPCIGGGMGLATACDLRVCSDTARFQLPPARLGVVYSASDTANLTACVGPAMAKAMLLTGRGLSAEEACAAGLVMDVLPAKAFEAQVTDLLNEIATQSGASLRAMKATFLELSGLQPKNAAHGWARHVAGFSSPDFKATLEKGR